MDAHVVEDQRAALEAVRQKMNCCPLPGDELPIHPDLAIDLGRGGVRRKRARHGAGMYHAPAGWTPGSPLPGKSSGRRGRCVTPGPLGPLHPRYREDPMKRMIRKAAEVVTASAGLYREMTLNALRLMPGRS